MLEVSVPCGACGKPVKGGDDFCEACGAQVSLELKEALRRRMEVSDLGYGLHADKVRKAQSTIRALSVLFLLGGVVFFFITKLQTDEALAKLAGASEAAPLENPVAGAATVGELRAELARKPYQLLGLNLFLAVVMLGLWFWSKRSLLPAIIAAFGIYVMVIVGSALVDPATLAQGVIIKIIVIAALAKGIQSALAARKLETAR